MIRLIILSGLYWGRVIYRNYHTYPNILKLHLDPRAHIIEIWKLENEEPEAKHGQ